MRPQRRPVAVLGTAGSGPRWPLCLEPRGDCVWVAGLRARVRVGWGVGVGWALGAPGGTGESGAWSLRGCPVTSSPSADGAPLSELSWSSSLGVVAVSFSGLFTVIALMLACLCCKKGGIGFKVRAGCPRGWAACVPSALSLPPLGGCRQGGPWRLPETQPTVAPGLEPLSVDTSQLRARPLGVVRRSGTLGRWGAHGGS